MSLFRGQASRISGYFSFGVLFLIILAYFVTHKPVAVLFTGNILGAGWSILSAILLTSVAGGLGRRLFPLLTFQPLVRNVLQAGLGFGGMGIGMLVIGGVGGLTVLIAWVILIILLTALFKEIQGWWGEWSGLREFWSGGGALSRAIALGILFIFFWSLILALAPPLKFDTLVYHLTLPHRYILSRALVYLPENMFWGMPQSGELLYTWVILLAGDRSAVILGVIWGGLTLIGLLGLAGEKFGSIGGWISLAALLSGFTLAAGLSWGYVDWLVMLFGLGFLAAMMELSKEDSRSNLVVSAVFAGLALGAKYTGGILLVSGVLFLLFGIKNSTVAATRLKKAFSWLFLAVLTATPWLVKNWLATGNPFYPFFFPSGAMSAFRLEQYRGGPAESFWYTVALLPFRATILGVEAAPGYGASIGPLLLGLGIIGLVGWKSMGQEEKNFLRPAAWLVLPGMAIWAAASLYSDYLLQTRLYMVIFPGLALVAGAGHRFLDSHFQNTVRLGWLAGILVTLVLWVEVIELGGDTLRKGAFQAAAGYSTSRDYLTSNLGWYYPAMEAVNALPEGANVLMLWEPRSLYCLPRCTPDDILDRWQREVRDTPPGTPFSRNSLLDRWQEQGFTHLLYHKFGADFIRREDPAGYRQEDWLALDEFLDGLPVVEKFGAAYILYAIKQ